MKYRLWIWVIFVCTVIVAQLAVPAKMILDQESTLKGRLFKLKTRPIDPHDVFRGKYISLSFEMERIPLTSVILDGIENNYQGKAYVTLMTNKDGFASVQKISLKPALDDSSFEVNIQYIQQAGTNIPDPCIVLKVPFDRYYVKENKASEAERIYRERSNQNKKDAFVFIRVKKGTVALENLFVDGKPIHDILTGKP